MWSSETCGMVPADNSSIYPQQKWNSKIWHTYIVLPTQYKCISSSNIFDMLTFKFMLKKTQQVFLPPQNKTNPILLIVELFAMRGSDDGCSDMSRQGRQGRCLLDELVKKCEMNSINIGVVFNWSGWAMGFSGLFSNDVKHQLKNPVKPSAWHFVNQRNGRWCRFVLFTPEPWEDDPIWLAQIFQLNWNDHLNKRVTPLKNTMDTQKWWFGKPIFKYDHFFVYLS